MFRTHFCISSLLRFTKQCPWREKRPSNYNFLFPVYTKICLSKILITRCESCVPLYFSLFLLVFLFLLTVPFSIPIRLPFSFITFLYSRSNKNHILAYHITFLYKNHILLCSYTKIIILFLSVFFFIAPISQLDFFGSVQDGLGMKPRK